MRNNLVVKFRCSECGSILNLLYQAEVRTKDHGGLKPTVLSPPDPTGAAKVEIPAIYIAPCGHCIEKYTGPAKMLSDALKILSDTQGE